MGSLSWALLVFFMWHIGLVAEGAIVTLLSRMCVARPSVHTRLDASDWVNLGVLRHWPPPTRSSPKFDGLLRAFEEMKRKEMGLRGVMGTPEECSSEVSFQTTSTLRSEFMFSSFIFHCVFDPMLALPHSFSPFLLRRWLGVLTYPICKNQ